MKVYCEDCKHYFVDDYFGTSSDCCHPSNKLVHVGDTYRSKEYGYLWYAFSKNKNNDCELFEFKEKKSFWPWRNK